jgi:predicted acyltransferase
MKKIFSAIKAIGKPIMTGALQSVPGGNALVKTVPAVVAMIKGKYADIPAKDKPQWMEVLIELVIVGVIVYSFATHAITVDEVLRLIRM